MEKLVERLPVYIAAKAYQQDVRGVHADIGLRGHVLDEAIGREEARDQLTVAKPVDSQPFCIPVPGETHAQDDAVLQRFLFEDQCQ